MACSQDEADIFPPTSPVLWPRFHPLSPFDVGIVGADASAIEDVSTKQGGVTLGEIGDCNYLSPLLTTVNM